MGQQQKQPLDEIRRFHQTGLQDILPQIVGAELAQQTSRLGGQNDLGVAAKSKSLHKQCTQLRGEMRAQVVAG